MPAIEAYRDKRAIYQALELAIVGSAIPDPWDARTQYLRRHGQLLARAEQHMKLPQSA